MANQNTFQVTGTTAKRDLAMSRVERVVADLRCAIFGHAATAGNASVETVGGKMYHSQYCGRCWKRGYDPTQEVLLAETVLTPLCSDPDRSHGQTWTRTLRETQHDPSA